MDRSEGRKALFSRRGDGADLRSEEENAISEQTELSAKTKSRRFLRLSRYKNENRKTLERVKRFWLLSKGGGQLSEEYLNE